MKCSKMMLLETEPKPDEVGVLDELMHKAMSRGYLITDDLLAAFPEAEDNMAQLDEIFIQLINQGIEVYTDTEEARGRKTPQRAFGHRSPNPGHRPLRFKWNCRRRHH